MLRPHPLVKARERSAIRNYSRKIIEQVKTPGAPSPAVSKQTAAVPPTDVSTVEGPEGQTLRPFFLGVDTLGDPNTFTPAAKPLIKYGS